MTGDDGTREVIISRTLTWVEKYHLPDADCNHRARINSERRVTEEFARNAGLGLCATCDPETERPNEHVTARRRSLRDILSDRETA